MKTTKTYLGSNCKNCGLGERYKSTSACIHCAKFNSNKTNYMKRGKIFTGVLLSEKQIEYLDRQEYKEKNLLWPPERQKAKDNGKRYYHGIKCRNCDSTQKYVSTRSCVNCTNTRAKSVYQSRKVSKQEAT